MKMTMTITSLNLLRQLTLCASLPLPINSISHAASIGNTAPPAVNGIAIASDHLVEAQVNYCSDGDTCRITLQPQKLWLSVRLFGIDAPETSKSRQNKKGQAMGREAKDFLNATIQNKTVKVLQADLDQYNRPIVELYFDNKNVNLMLVEEGLAESYKGKTKRIDKKPYEIAESRAKLDKKGIWSLKSYESPADFRKRTSH